jgi:methionyl-tRNA formyltransferase
MRLIVMGQQAFGKDVLEKIIQKGVDEVVAVYCEPDKEGRPVDPIKEFAIENKISVIQPVHFKDKDTLQKLASYKADLMLMAFVNIFQTPRQLSLSIGMKT